MTWKKTLIKSDSSIRQVIEVIDSNEFKIALVVDHNERLIGTITDGDIRRAILKGISLDESIVKIIYKKPITVSQTASYNEALFLMKQKKIRHIPRIDLQNKVTGLEIIKNVLNIDSKLPPVIIMAGGLSTRLRPITDNCPKPMLSIGGKPILETIISNLKKVGFKEFYISVNYHAETIIQYFGDGKLFDIQINYLHESVQVGTAGALKLLPSDLKSPVLVMNGDLLTNVDFLGLLELHNEQKADITMCVKEYDFQIPYGVVNIEHDTINQLEEKPIHSFFINAGIYVINPNCFNFIPENTRFDMTQLIKKSIDHQKKCIPYPIHEYWLDIGQHQDFERAKKEFEYVFR